MGRCTREIRDEPWISGYSLSNHLQVPPDEADGQNFVNSSLCSRAIGDTFSKVQAH
jgi:hypothetical protein